MRVDVVIVGGGPAGLSAALVLGRCQRRVLVFDDGRYRNAASQQLHGFLTRDRTSSPELRAIARAELARYSTVSVRAQTIADARRTDDRFAVLTTSGEQIDTAALLLATGFTDTQPTIAGVRELVVPCPYCPVRGVEVSRRQQTNVPGLYVAGDATRDVLQAIVAAGEGSAAAVCINEYLTERGLYAESPTQEL